ncbi:MAG: helix-turn-helix domain-containing protein, partial [Candidatus Palauibacterales bacterium]|nr:helix-turn-helix domain-containing protein [Candidatus Palauibacterales bacterium]
PDQLPELLGQLAYHQARINLSLNSPPKPAPTNALDRQLTAHEVSELLSLSEKWVYAHRTLLGGRKLGGSVRYSECAIRRFLASR